MKLKNVDLCSGVLPSHMKVNIYEEYARCVLAWLDPPVYSSLVISDKPDLIDNSNSLGVEVTIAIHKDDIEGDKLFQKYCENANKKGKEKLEKRLHQLGMTVSDYSCVHPVRKDDFSLIQQSYRNKLHLLNNGGYFACKENHLFIMSDILADKLMLKEALLDFKEVLTDDLIPFKRVIIAVPGFIYIFDLSLNDCHMVEFDNEKQFQLAMQAREHVLEYE